MTHDERVTRLAEQMAGPVRCLSGEAKVHLDCTAAHEKIVNRLLPYAAAMVQMAEALDSLLESPARFGDFRMDYAERQVDARAWTEARAALSAYRALNPAASPVSAPTRAEELAARAVAGLDRRRAITDHKFVDCEYGAAQHKGKCSRAGL